MLGSQHATHGNHRCLRIALIFEFLSLMGHTKEGAVLACMMCSERKLAVPDLHRAENVRSTVERLLDFSHLFTTAVLTRVAKHTQSVLQVITLQQCFLANFRSARPCRSSPVQQENH